MGIVSESCGGCAGRTFGLRYWITNHFLFLVLGGSSQFSIGKTTIMQQNYDDYDDFPIHKGQPSKAGKSSGSKLVYTSKHLRIKEAQRVRTKATKK